MNGILENVYFFSFLQVFENSDISSTSWRWFLRIFINSNRNFTDDFSQWPLDNTDEDAVEKATQRVVSLSVYYESFAYTMSEESPKTDIVSMFASMGGSLSLFLGVSLFSLFEVVDVFVLRFLMWFRKGKQLRLLLALLQE